MKSPDRVPVSLRSRNATVRRATLLTESARLFVLRGYEATSVDEIARAAEVSRATVFNYFPTKRSILEEHYVRLAREIVSLIEASPKGRTRNRLSKIFRDAEKVLKREGKLFPILYREVFLAPNLTAMDESVEQRVFELYV